MTALGALFFFVLGTIIGSFLNVVIFRFNTGATFGGRSRCFSCGKTIRWYDLFPVVSFLLLGGRCRFCKSKLSCQYPLVELATGLLFLGVFLKHISSGFFTDFSIFYFLFFIDLLVFSLLVVISVYDLKHKIIPDSLALMFGFFALVHLFLTIPFSLLLKMPYLLDLLAGPVIAFPVFVLWLLSRGRWIGLGDAKLLVGMGWFLGFVYSVSAFVVGFWIGAIVGLFLLAVSKNKKMKITFKTELPLAPFLIAGLIVVYFSQFDIMGLSMLVNI